MDNGVVSIVVTGDFCPHNRVEELASGSDYKSIFNDFINVFRGNDLNITDLECPLTTRSQGRRKTGPHQKAQPHTARILGYAGISLAAMANNHIMDYGSEGVSDTLEACRVNGIITVGLGKNPEEAGNPYSVTLKGKKIAVLNYADNEFLSTPDELFTCNPLDPVTCYYAIAKARKTHDFLIVIIHAGNEFYELPSPRTKQLYRFISDLGADVVVSHHTHAFSGYEVYNSRLIFYGLGNFIYDWPGKINSSWNRGYIVKLKLADELDFEIIPLKQGNEKPGVFHLNSEEVEVFNKDLDRLNGIITDDLLLENEFQRYCASVYPMYDAFIEPYFGKYVTALRKRGLFPKLMTRRKRLLLLNISRCESHRDVLLRMLKRNE
jgi:poly-gamma-glutamate synthesis protein (capsule biosynthesis protein)